MVGVGVTVTVGVNNGVGVKVGVGVGEGAGAAQPDGWPSDGTPATKVTVSDPCVETLFPRPSRPWRTMVAAVPRGRRGRGLSGGRLLALAGTITMVAVALPGVPAGTLNDVPRVKGPGGGPPSKRE
jgi:hypothetical protein